jgi:hypothetical protein
MQSIGTGVTEFLWTVRDYLHICYTTFSLSHSSKGFVRPFLGE